MEWEEEAPIQDRTQGIIYPYVIIIKITETVPACYNKNTHSALLALIAYRESQNAYIPKIFYLL